MAISENHKEESISLAHIYAIAGKAGMIVEKGNLDYGVDGRFSAVSKYQGKLIQNGPSLPFQLKACRNIAHLANGTQVSYEMEVDAYKRLRYQNSDPDNPLILLVCELHNSDAHWVVNELEQLTLKKCCYYHKFFNMPDTGNGASITVRLEKANLLTPASLTTLLEALRDKTYHA